MFHGAFPRGLFHGAFITLHFICCEPLQCWFLHVLPQLAGRQWYGKQVQQVLQAPGDTIFVPSRSAHTVLNLDNSLAVTENIMTVESLLELPHKLLLGEALLPDMEDIATERQEERMWKCLTRGQLLDKAERQVLKSMAGQVERRMTAQPNTCTSSNYGRSWMATGKEKHLGSKTSTNVKA